MVSQSGRNWAGDAGWRDEADRYGLRGDVTDHDRLNEAPCLCGVFALGLAAPPCTEGRRRHVLTDSRIASTIVAEFRAGIGWLHPVNGE